MKLYKKSYMNGYGTKPSQLKDSIDYAARRFTNVNPINYYNLRVGFIKNAFDSNCEKAYVIHTTFNNIKIAVYIRENSTFRIPANRIMDGPLVTKVIPRKLGYTFYYKKKWRRYYETL